MTAPSSCPMPPCAVRPSGTPTSVGSPTPATEPCAGSRGRGEPHAHGPRGRFGARALSRDDHADPRHRGAGRRDAVLVPLQSECKHVVATLLRSNAAPPATSSRAEAPSPRAGRPPAGVGSGVDVLAHDRDGPREAATWRAPCCCRQRAPMRDLALGVELRVRESASAAHWGPRRMRPAMTADLRGERAELSVGFRPLARSLSTGAWVRSDVSIIRRDAGGFRDAQRRWFIELQVGIAHDARLRTTTTSTG